MEKIDDILREMRGLADEAERGGCYDLRGLGTDSLRAYADCIEAAANHQFRDTTKMIPEEVAVSKMETTTPTCEKSSQVGNAAAMREAVKTALEELLLWNYTDRDTARMALGVMNRLDAALSAPPRNCDVGTAEEQHSRFGCFCDKYEDCKECPVWHGGGPTSECSMYWTQMPYGRQ